MEPLPSHEDLIWLFEAEPVYPHADDEQTVGYQPGWRQPWPYTAVMFQTSRAGFDIEMYIEPGYEVVRLRLRTTANGAELLHLDLHGVRSVGAERANGRELLRLDFPDSALAATVRLQMKPGVMLYWAYDATT